jgi:hypothetical protein
VDDPPSHPAPKRTLRSAALAVMATSALAAALLAYSIHDDALYALHEGDAVELEDFSQADVERHANSYVRSRVELEAPATKFQRPLEQSHYRVAKAGTDRWVVYAVPDGYPEPRFLAPKLVAGRLVKATDLGARFGSVSKTTGANAWVLVDGDAPYGSTWLLGLEAMLLGFMLFNLGGIATVVRPVR